MILLQKQTALIFIKHIVTYVESAGGRYMWTELALLFIAHFVRALLQSSLSLQTLLWLFSEGGLTARKLLDHRGTSS